ncbi:MAG: TonB-dependent receptor [Reichenbachiella sp.]
MAQESKLMTGVLLNSNKNPISDAQVVVLPDSVQTITNAKGAFQIKISSASKSIEFHHIQYQDAKQVIDFSRASNLTVSMRARTNVLKDVNISDEQIRLDSDFSNISIAHKDVYTMPNATGDFNTILGTLPGVSSNNELSSAYAVRGGNYDENLIYVNGIKIYRPQIVSAGRQEGLSFVNPHLVRNVEFSAGGWRAEHGDKLSSVLDIQYKEPIDNEATIDLGLLGGSIYIGGKTKDNSLTYTLSARHKNTKYLLGTLETQGEYLPKFTDVQSYVSKRIGEKTKIGFLLSSAFNNYETVPASKQTDFGTIQTSFRLNVLFEGREELKYNTNQFGTILTHSFSDQWLSKLVLSTTRSIEKEYYEVVGYYRLCDLNTDIGSNQFDECINVLGAGTNYDYGRNQLEANIVNADLKNEVNIGKHLLEFGMSWDHEVIQDHLDEYSFVDSADYVTELQSVDNQVDINSDKISGFVQFTSSIADSTHIFNIGVRANHWTYSSETLLSPRMQYLYRFGSLKRNQIRVSGGLYGQHPFYRELRNREGQINPSVKAQKSVQALVAWDRNLQIWGRPFKMNTEAYYKYLWDVNPYEVDNVKIRYYATNQAVAFAYGLDFRINGEFIEGTESWFSLSYLKTEENLYNGQGYIRRPTDQRLSLGIFFQDHMPNNPSLKASLNLQFGSGLPFGPPNSDEFRNIFSGDQYARVDVGFSKSIALQEGKKIVPNHIWIGLDILNLLGADNTISYSWIKDVNGNQFAVPNSLSARFFNLRIIAKF